MRMHSSEISKIIENFINTDKSLWEDLYGVNKKFIQILFNNHPEISFLKSYEETQRICEFDNPFKEDIIWSNKINLPKVKNSNTFGDWSYRYNHASESTYMRYGWEFSLHPKINHFIEEIFFRIMWGENSDRYLEKFPQRKSELISEYNQQKLNNIVDLVRICKDIEGNLKPSEIYIIQNDLDADLDLSFLQLLKIYSEYITWDDLKPWTLKFKSSRIVLLNEKPNLVSYDTKQFGNILIVYPIEILDIDLKIKELKSEIERLSKNVNSIESKLSNSGFIDKAPKNIIDSEKKKLNDMRSKLNQNLDIWSELFWKNINENNHELQDNLK